MSNYTFKPVEFETWNDWENSTLEHWDDPDLLLMETRRDRLILVAVLEFIRKNAPEFASRKLNTKQLNQFIGEWLEYPEEDERPTVVEAVAAKICQKLQSKELDDYNGITDYFGWLVGQLQLLEAGRGERFKPAEIATLTALIFRDGAPRTTAGIVKVFNQWKGGARA